MKFSASGPVKKFWNPLTFRATLGDENINLTHLTMSSGKSYVKAKWKTWQAFSGESTSISLQSKNSTTLLSMYLWLKTAASSRLHRASSDLSPLETDPKTSQDKSQLHQMVFFFRFKSSRSKNLEGVDVSTSNKELSLSDYRDQDREEREYHYVSYDEISKRGSYENKSPSQSYVYDVTWF